MTTTVSLPPHTLMLGDCLERMKEIPDGSVDMVMCDLPYQTTDCSWDNIIPFKPLWDHYRRVVRCRSAIVLTASQPFASDLIQSGKDIFRYEWIWVKDRKTGAMNAKIMPMKGHETVLVFGRKTPIYYRILEKRERPITAKTPKSGSPVYLSKQKSEYTRRTDTKCPDSVLYFSTERGLHPTQKPVSLLEYMIRTYTKEGETVLDNCFGSASTGIACINTGRRFIGIEKHEPYFDIGRRRMEDAMRKAAQPAPQGGLFDSIAAE